VIDQAEAEYVIGSAALALSTNWRTYQALVRGLPLPYRCLDARVLKVLGLLPDDRGSLVLTLDDALLIEACRPRGGYFGGQR
jgi:hypothetical protein